MDELNKAVEIDLKFRAKLKSLEKGLTRAEKRIERFERRGINIPLRLDTSGIFAQAAKARREITSAIGQAQGGGRVSDGGIIIPTGSNFANEINEAKKRATAIKQATSTVFEPNEDTGDLAPTKRVISSVDQLEKGLSKTTTTTESLTNEGAKLTQQVEKFTDTRPIENFRSALRGATKAADDDIAKAARANDQDGQLRGLEKRQELLKRFLGSEVAQPFAGDPDFRRANDGLTRLGATIDRLKGKQLLKQEAEESEKAVQRLRRETRKALGDSSKQIKEAQGANNVPEQIKGLERQQLALRKVLQDNRKLSDTSQFRSAEGKLDSVNDRLANLQGRTDNRAVKDDFNARIRNEEKFLANQLRRNAIEQAEAKSIPKKIDREKRVNDLLKQRENLLKNSEARSRFLANQARQAGQGDLGDKADRRAEKTRRALQADEKARTSAQSATERKNQEQSLQRELDSIKNQTKAYEKQIKARTQLAQQSGTETARQQAKLTGLKEEADLFQRANTAAASVSKRASDAGFSNLSRAASQEASTFETKKNLADNNTELQKAANLQKQKRDGLRNELDLLKASTDQQIAQNKAFLRGSSSLTSSQEKRNKLARESLKIEQGILQASQQKSRDIGSRAQAEGFNDLARNATRYSSTTGKRLIATQNAVTESTRKSGRAFSFHGSSLLRNARSFGRWQLAATAVLAPIAAISIGLRNAVRADRQFATLAAVFQGTAQEAQQLKRDTLLLAAANGRSSEEALDSAVAYARLGLTRVQTNELIEASLKAANVGEIEAAEATRKLISIYKAFNLEVGEVPATLDRLNALTNRYAVTLTDLFEGIARAGAISKQAGLDLVDLEGIITAVTAATGRAGSESGNFIKFLATRLRRPETLEKLKENFDIDLTDASGEIKTMSEILRDLAGIYPNLTRTQQAFFLDTAAGSRQANRLALVLENWTEGQIAATRALGDVNSAANENEKITASLASQLEQLSTSWTAFLTVLADGGAFKFAAEQISSLGVALQDLGDLNVSSRIAPEPGRQQINDLPLRDAVSEALQLRDDASKGFVADYLDIGDPSGRSDRELRRAAKTTQLIIDYLETVRDTQEEFESLEELEQKTQPARDLLSFLRDTELGILNASQLEFNAKFDNADELARQEGILKRINALIQERDTAETAITTEDITTDLNNQRGLIEQFKKAQATIELIKQDISRPSADLGRSQKQINDFRDTITNLPDGNRVAASVIPAITDALGAGNIEAAREELTALQKLFRDTLPEFRDNIQETADEALVSLESQADAARQKVKELNEELANPNSTEDNAILEANLKDAEDEFKLLTDAIRAVKKAIDETADSSSKLDFSQSRSFQKLEERITKISEALKAVVSEQTVPGADNLERRLDRQLAAERIKLDLLEQQLQVTRDRANADAANKQGDLDFLREFIDTTKAGDTGLDESPFFKQQEEEARQLEHELAVSKELISLAETKARIERAAFEKRKQDIQDQIAAARIQEAFQKSVESTSQITIPFRFGRNESESLFNEADFALSRGRLASENALASQGHFDSDATRNATERGAALALEATARENINSLTRRQFELERLINQAQVDQTRELERQTEEARIKLNLADRETQLREASARAFLSNNRGPSELEFRFLSQPTRQTFADFFPETVPFADNSSSRREQQELVQELGQLRRVLPEFQRRLAATTATNNRLSPGITPGQAGITIPASQDIANGVRSPNVQLNLGGIDINIGLSSEIDAIRDQVINTLRPALTQEIQDAFANLAANTGPGLLSRVTAAARQAN